MFRSSFGSCRSKTTPDVIQQPFFFPQNRQHYQLIDLFSPKPKPFPSICRPKWREMVEDKDEGCVRHKVSDRNSLVSVRTDGRKCPQPSPISPLDTKLKPNPKQRRSKKSNRKRKNTHSCEFNSAIEANYYGLYSSDDEEYDDETTLFSSKSLSSDSSGSLRRTARRRNESGKARRRALGKKHSEVNLTPVEVKVSKSLSSDSSESFRQKGDESGKARARAVGREADVMTMEGKVKDSFAVVKRSSDPYNDFRTSMVEMIIERQIFGGKDLEDLLQCFLSLNSQCHHRVIVEVFTEIWETLFSNWC
ncbi:hypothetical protein LguiB_011697 [Lonicera macranthoides]